MNPHHAFKRIIICVIIFSMTATLSGCVFYHESSEHYIKRRLEERYGEEFEIKTTCANGEVIAYPVNDPDLLFRASYSRSTQNGYNDYLQEIVCRQYTDLIKENLADFEYKYYIDTDIKSYTDLGVDSEITIDEYIRLNGSLDNPRIKIFISCEAFSLTDDELYNIFTSALNIQQDGWFSIYFITNEELDYIEEYYSKYSSFGDDLGRYLLDNFVGAKDNTQIRIPLAIDKGEFKVGIDGGFDEFKLKMQEVRNNELYR